MCRPLAASLRRFCLTNGYSLRKFRGIILAILSCPPFPLLRWEPSKACYVALRRAGWPGRRWIQGRNSSRRDWAILFSHSLVVCLLLPLSLGQAYQLKAVVVHAL